MENKYRRAAIDTEVSIRKSTPSVFPPPPVPGTPVTPYSQIISNIRMRTDRMSELIEQLANNIAPILGEPRGDGGVTENKVTEEPKSALIRDLVQIDGRLVLANSVLENLIDRSVL